MKTIICLTDFSRSARNATNYAARMAAEIRAELLLINICQMPVVLNDVPIPVFPENVQYGAEKDLASLKNELEKTMDGKINIRAEVIMGDFRQTVKELAEDVKPYAIVMGSQGTSPATRFILGSHVLYSMTHLAYPVIAVPPDSSDTGLKNIGLSSDLKDVKATIPFENLREFANDFHATLHVLNAGGERSYEPELVAESVKTETFLDPVKPKFHFISGIDEDQDILDFAVKNNYDMLIILPLKHSFFDNLIHRRHTTQYIRHAWLPVMSMHIHE